MKTNLSSNKSSTRPSAPHFGQVFWARLGNLLISENLILLPPNPVKVAMDEAEKQLRKASALALLSNWDSFGFVLSKKDMVELCQKNTATHAWLHEILTPALKKKYGAHVHMTPMYPNFPKQVMKMDEAELYFNAIVHYVGDAFGLSWLPSSEEKERKELKKKDIIKHKFKLVPFEELGNVMASLIEMKSVWTPQQVALIEHVLPYLMSHGLESVSVPSVENRARLNGYWLKNLAGLEGYEKWPTAGVTVTDVLRAIVVANEGDPSLSSNAEKVRIPRLARSQRRALMQALERAVSNHDDSIDELFTRRGHWLTVANALHVGEWSKKTPLASKMFEVLRTGQRPPSWNRQMDVLLESSFNAEGLKKLAFENPGYFVRNLRRSLLWAKDDANTSEVLKIFKDVAPVVSTQLLMDAKKVCESNPDYRMVMPKGNFAAHYVLDSDVKLRSSVIHKIQQIHDKVLLKRFAQLPELGKVHVEAAADGVLLPKGLRENSADTASISRGSSVGIKEDADIVRLFLWWKGRDIDLAALGLDENFKQTESCNYHNLKNAGMVHSGDIVSAYDGAAEFIDVNLKGLHPNTRYIGLAAHVFSGPTFKKHEECFVGWQERREDHQQRGKIMDVRTIVNKTTVESNSKCFMAAMFDVKERKLIWLDAPFPGQNGNSLLNQVSTVAETMKAMKMYSEQRPNMKDLVTLHVKARNGKLIDKAKDADTLFTLSDIAGNGKQVVYSAMFPRTFSNELLVGPTPNDYVKFNQKKEKVINPETKKEVLLEVLDSSLEKSLKKNKEKVIKVKATVKKTNKPR